MPTAGNREAPCPIDERLRETTLYRVELEKRFRESLVVDETLERHLVSYQGNKAEPFFRWYRYKEAFSAGLVTQLLREEGVPETGHLLDPFAGMGTALFVAGKYGLWADGIELLPLGATAIQAGIALGSRFTPENLATVRQWHRRRPWAHGNGTPGLNEITITSGAYPRETEIAIGRYLASMANENEVVRLVLLMAVLSVLESVSYTRKDGQYLRWDGRAGRSHEHSRFRKPEILSFDDAIRAKLSEVLTDLAKIGETPLPGADRVTLFQESCLDIMPRLRTGFYDTILTSPPYCNRYDYTRTYALELALLGVGNSGLKLLRQRMLSSTVENRQKDLLEMNADWASPIDNAQNQPLLRSIIGYLDELQSQNALNNRGIPRMIRGYFSEMSCVLFECFRVLKPGGVMFMVNDNVKYSGMSIPVDLILSDLASEIGFEVRKIRVLPRSKGNSSQQMGALGRDPLRKCVYVWRKPHA